MQIAHQKQILLHILRKADARVKNNLIRAHALLTQKLRTLRQIYSNLLYDVLILAVLLHILRRTAHMHQDNRRLAFDNNLRHTRVGLHSADIVDNVGTGIQRCLCRVCTIGVYRQHSLRIGSAQCADNGQNAAALLLTVHAVAAGARRFAADIQNTGAMLQHLSCTLHDRIHLRHARACIEGVRRNIQNAHNAHLFIGQHASIRQSRLQRRRL